MPFLDGRVVPSPAPPNLRFRSRGPAPFARVALAAAVAWLPFAGGGGCQSRTACFEFTPTEFAANGQSCPAQKDALPNFSDPECPGPIVSVDSAGSYDGELCCYQVTYDSIDPDCGNGNGGQGGAGGSGTCPASCADAVANGGMPCSNPASFDYSNLQSCGCSNCAFECSSFCSQLAAEPGCTPCLQMQCLGVFGTCLSN